MPGSSRPLNMLLTVALVLSLGKASFAQDKQLAVYAPQAAFAVPVTDHEGREYADVMAVILPLFPLTLKIDGERARFTGGTLESTFVNGENNVRVGQKRVRFPGKVIIADGRVQVPLVVLPALLQDMAGFKAELHEPGRRLFVENTQTRFSVELKKAEEVELALTFPMRVNPNISQEANKVKLVFRQEPVIMAPESVTFNDAHITGLRFEEKNGAAEVTISGTAPLLVTFSDQGKKLSIKLAPALAAMPPPAPAPSPTVTEPAAPATPAATTVPAATPPGPTAPALPLGGVRYFVMIDPGHGGSDPGVKFSDKLLEKDVTLVLAKRLRTELQNRGIPATLVREGDQTLSQDQRATAANGQRAAIYITLHAGELGSGVRVYATVMPSAEPVQGPFIPWQRAQEAFRERSQFLARAVANEVRAKKLPGRMLSAAISPLHAIAAPAIAIEVAPPKVGAPVEEFEKAAYQVAIAGAVATAIANVRNKLEEMR